MSTPYGDGMMFEPDSPNPISVGEGEDTRSRYGHLTPLSVKLDNYYQGVSVGQLTMLTVTNAAQFLPRVDSAVSALLQVQTESIRWAVDGTTPTAAVGFEADPNTLMRITGPQDLRSFQMIRETGVDSIVAVTFFA